MSSETTMSPARIWPDDPQSRIAELEHAIIDAQKREDALIAERDALAERVKALEVISEEIAKGWDDCYYDDDMPRWSIGDRIRHDTKRLIDEARPEARNV